ncbi:pyridoxamine 5'-phosphate oxidase family protein [Cryptosporangium phraense]|uniref:Pyridoxamine 5'-phosphate oxidase family protein n=1 Tax=Cryptosporangium phraense TaxID=2593070 RepID=A0A545AGF1_9ACTN|nr:pyridoxamine 5'-phosphate oxidase family protein [Cryptosporangium phraense]TQS39725.1 pyridoxamine 5'-phosphate oxidase family protein [Cryptosporangium phraense]
MGKTYARLDDRLRTFIDAQPVFFVATAPLAADGSVNLSPKGRSGSLAVLDETTLAYLDFGGSHAETIAHLRENGRITLMWCAFAGPPTVLRVHGRGEPVYRDDPRFATLMPALAGADAVGVRAIILVTAERISDSCGFAVPLMEYREDRSMHADFFGRKGEEGFADYCASKEFNRSSIDGLPGVPLPLPPRTDAGAPA